MNNSLIKNKDYLNIINKIIYEEKGRYCLPIFNVNFTEENFKDLTFSNDDMFLETLFLRC